MASTATALKQSLGSLRSRLKIDEAETRRSGAAFLGAFLLGVMEKPREGDTPEAREPLISRVPDLFGMPKTASLAVGFKVAAQYADGEMADYFNGIGDAAAVIALHGFAKGEQVAGVAGVGRASATSDKARIRNLEAMLARRLKAQGGDDDDDRQEIADLVAALADD